MQKKQKETNMSLPFFPRKCQDMYKIETSNAKFSLQNLNHFLVEIWKN